MGVTADQLKAAMPHASADNVARFAQPISDACDECGVNTPERIAAFLAQIAHESGSLHYVEEIASGNAYEGRADLGNTEPGDGPRFKGRGLIQITGRANYKTYGDLMNVDLIAEPDMLTAPLYAAWSAALFWERRGLNAFADNGDFETITKRINGGLNGYQDRLQCWAEAKDALGVA